MVVWSRKKNAGTAGPETARGQHWPDEVQTKQGSAPGFFPVLQAASSWSQSFSIFI